LRHGPVIAQLMPLSFTPSPNTLTNKVLPSGLKQAPANSEDLGDAGGERIAVVSVARRRVGIVLAEEDGAARGHAQVIGRVEHATRRRCALLAEGHVAESGRQREDGVGVLVRRRRERTVAALERGIGLRNSRRPSLDFCDCIEASG
jgi:hypothetical protein